MQPVWRQDDLDAMQAALAEAETASGEGEIPVGAIVVANGEIIATGRNCSVATSDPSGHAEIVALRAAGESVGNYRL